MKDFIVNQLEKSKDLLLHTKTFNEMYQAGLTDVRGPKAMKLRISKDRMDVSYWSFPFYKTFTVRPQDIIQLELGVETVNTGGKTFAGAIGGAMVGGILGAVAGAAGASKQSKEDTLNLVIRYKGENRPLVLQNSRNTQKIYQMLKQMQ